MDVAPLAVQVTTHFRHPELNALDVPDTRDKRLRTLLATLEDSFEAPYRDVRSGDFIRALQNKMHFDLYATNKDNDYWNGEMPFRLVHVTIALVTRVGGRSRIEDARIREHQEQMLTEAAVNVALKKRLEMEPAMSVNADGVTRFYTYTRCVEQGTREKLARDWIGAYGGRLRTQVFGEPQQSPVGEEPVFSFQAAQSIPLSSLSSAAWASQGTSSLDTQAPALPEAKHLKIVTEERGEPRIHSIAFEDKDLADLLPYSAAVNEMALYQLIVTEQDPVRVSVEQYLRDREHFTFAQIKLELAVIYAQLFVRLAWLNSAFDSFEHGNLHPANVFLAWSMPGNPGETPRAYDVMRVSYTTDDDAPSTIIIPLQLSDGRVLQLDNFGHSVLTFTSDDGTQTLGTYPHERDALMCRHWWRDILTDTSVRNSPELRELADALERSSTLPAPMQWTRHIRHLSLFNELRVARFPSLFDMYKRLGMRFTEDAPPRVVDVTIPRLTAARRVMTQRIQANVTGALPRVVLTAPHAFCSSPNESSCDPSSGPMFDALVAALKRTSRVQLVAALKNTDTRRSVLDLNRAESRTTSKMRRSLTRELAQANVLIDVHSMSRGAFVCSEKWGRKVMCKADVVLLSPHDPARLFGLVTQIRAVASVNQLPAHPEVNDILAEAGDSGVSLRFILEVAEDLPSKTLTSIADAIAGWL